MYEDAMRENEDSSAITVLVKEVKSRNEETHKNFAVQVQYTDENVEDELEDLITDGFNNDGIPQDRITVRPWGGRFPGDKPTASNKRARTDFC